MYTSHFNLTSLPFENVPDPEFFFGEGSYASTLERISASLAAGRGLILVTGPIGSGKTTLSQMIITGRAQTTSLIWMAEPPREAIDLYAYIARELNIDTNWANESFMLADIRKTLSAMKTDGKRCLLIIDECHVMGESTFNAVRLLNNLEDKAAKLIQILMLGQNEILEKLEQPGMESFKQRIASVEILGMLKGDEILKYVIHRVQTAGGGSALFSVNAWNAILKTFSSGGTPRVINSLCNQSLQSAYEHGRSEVDTRDVYAASKRIGLDGKLYFHVADSVTSKTATVKAEVENTNQAEKVLTESAQNSSAAEDIGDKANDESEKLHALLLRRENTDRKQHKEQLATTDKVVPLDMVEAKHLSSNRGYTLPLLALVVSAAVLYFSFTNYCRAAGEDDAASCSSAVIELGQERLMSIYDSLVSA